MPKTPLLQQFLCVGVLAPPLPTVRRWALLTLFMSLSFLFSEMMKKIFNNNKIVLKWGNIETKMRKYSGSITKERGKIYRLP